MTHTDGARAQLLQALQHHRPVDADEAAACARLGEFVSRVADPFARTTREGHVTGSAVVLAPDGRALLLFHARLSLWVQPGGHLEPGEAPHQGALREALEESGLPDLRLDPGEDGAPLLLDVDVHPIPANLRRQEPAHHHHDLCFLARTQRPEATRHDPDESHAFRWVTAAEAAALPLDTATRRRLRKVLAG